MITEDNNMPLHRPQRPTGKWVTVTDLIGDSVRNSAGEKLGQIEEFILDSQTGEIGYAIISLIGVLALGDKIFPVPWQALHADIDNRCFVIAAEKDDFARAPGFNRDDWPDVFDAAQAGEISRYYQSIPHRALTAKDEWNLLPA